ncbi:hypothetical protein MBLNU457_6689t1 [Dothideomycetes sp. NU457]
MDGAAPFETNWSVSDAAGLLPKAAPTRHIPRAWERKPYSPFSRKGAGSKVWRRVQMPSLSNLARVNSSKGPECIDHQPGGTIQSPRKITKRICLNNGLGQDWKIADWDRGRGTHHRKLAPRAPIVLRSGAVLDPNLEDEEEEVPDNNNNNKQEAEPEIRDENDPEDEWSDVSSELDQDEHEEEDMPEDKDAQIATVVTSPPNTSLETLPQPQRNPQASPIKLDPHRKDSPLSDEDGDFTAKFAIPTETATFPSPVKRSTSAPPEESLTQETRSRPRICDDTAILRAFLNRAAATKKPMAKRESITNRRDSDTVRQALASPTKTDVLMELNPNSPSPRKESPEKTESAKPVLTSPSQDKAVTAPKDDEKPARRSSRSRAKPALLLNQMVPKQPVRGPNKITIRGPADQLPLKRSEVQEMSAVTRSNTRKNKGQAVMPLERLPELAAELAGEGGQFTDKEIPPNSKGRSVRWDQTLAYFQENPSEPSSLEIEKVEAPVLAGDLPQDQNPITTEAPPLSPTKTRSRRTRPAPSTTERTEAKPPPVDEAKPKTAAPAPKRKSRIATPAKALLSSTTSLLPPDVVPPSQSKPDQPATKKTRSLPAPRKLNFAAPKDAAPAPATPSVQLSTPKKTPSATTFSGIPGIKSFAPPSFGGSVSAVSMMRSTGERDEGAVPGLASPAKKRRAVRGAAAGNGNGGVKAVIEEPVLGLASPAKKRVRGLF